MSVTITSDNPLMQEHIKDALTLCVRLTTPLLKMLNTGYERTCFDTVYFDKNQLPRHKKKLFGPVAGEYLDTELERNIFIHYAKLWNQCRSLVDFRATYVGMDLDDDERPPEDDALYQVLSNAKNFVWDFMGCIVDSPVFWPFIDYADALQIDPTAKPTIPREQQLEISATLRELLTAIKQDRNYISEDIETMLGFVEYYLAERSGGVDR